MNDPKEIQIRKAFSFFSVLAAMGNFVYAPWRPKAFVGAPAAKPYKARWENGRLKPPAAGRPEHVAAVAAMREARKLKRIRKAENLLAEKRKRIKLQSIRHLVATMKRHARAA